jgi:hypothetical protein
VNQRKYQIPEAYELLEAASRSVQDRAWTSFNNLLTANSIFVLAWAALFVEDAIPGRAGVMIGISVLGIVTGLQWALLGTRTWDYVLAYGKEIRELWASNQNLDPDFKRLSSVDTAIGDRWKLDRWWLKPFIVSANHWILFTVPLALSALHMVMITIVVCCESGKPPQCYPLRFCFAQGLGAWWLLYVASVAAVIWKCYPSLIRTPAAPRTEKQVADKPH